MYIRFVFRISGRYRQGYRFILGTFTIWKLYCWSTRSPHELPGPRCSDTQGERWAMTMCFEGGLSMAESNVSPTSTWT